MGYISQRKEICFIHKNPRKMRGFLCMLKGLLSHSLLNGNGNSNGSTYHRVVTHTEEAHHLNVCGN